MPRNQLSNHEKEKITTAAFSQIIDAGLSPETQLIITSSSSGSVVAAQTACYLAERNRNNIYFQETISSCSRSQYDISESDLYKHLLHHQKEGTIGTILHDEVQDEGDSSAGVGGLTRGEAYRNAFGLIFPLFSKKFKGTIIFKYSSGEGTSAS